MAAQTIVICDVCHERQGELAIGIEADGTVRRFDLCAGCSEKTTAATLRKMSLELTSQGTPLKSSKENR